MTTTWDDFPTDMPPVAPFTGPFAHRPFLEAVERAVRTRPEDLDIRTADDAAVALVVDDGLVRLAGPEDLTDYHAPLGPGAGRLLAEALRDHAGSDVRLDSLPEEAVGVVVDAVRGAGGEPTVVEHEVAAVLRLPDSLDDWLMSLGKKERHEVRRKRRRFIEQFGDIEIVEFGEEGMGTFCEMHRSSSGAKGAFMTEEMEAFFSELLVSADAVIHALVCNGTVRASAFGFETTDGYYYYNSAYDPDAAMASPGVVLLSSMIEDQIARGATVFDLLKGGERYKFRHGAEPRTLLAVEGVIP